MDVKRDNRRALPIKNPVAWRGQLIGLLCWIGAFSYVIYNYLAYLFAVQFSWLFILYLNLVVFSLYALVALLISAVKRDRFILRVMR